MKKLCFVFRSLPGRGIGGAERSMLRLMHHVHGKFLDCRIILVGHEIAGFESELAELKIPLTMTYNLRQLLAEFKRNRPDFVYLFTRAYLPVWGGLAKLAKVPVTIGAVRGSTDTLTDRLFFPLTNLFIDKYITNSKYAAQQLISSGIAAKKIATIYNGIDFDKFSADMNSQEALIRLPEDKIFITTVANISPIKGIPYLLRAVQAIQEKYPNVCALLIGRDYTYGKFFPEIERAGLSNTYLWIGGVKNVLPYLKKSSIFVLPSLHEGMSTAILEAMLVGLPIVATEVGGNPELIRDQKTGFLVPPKNIKALEKAILNILDSGDETRAALGANSRNHVLENHSIKNMVMGHLKVFDIDQTYGAK
jgi:glycosyltransferase involved in cell wall biosynthesis